MSPKSRRCFFSLSSSMAMAAERGYLLAKDEAECLEGLRLSREHDLDRVSKYDKLQPLTYSSSSRNSSLDLESALSIKLLTWSGCQKLMYCWSTFRSSK